MGMLDGKRALVTGVGPGLGTEVALVRDVARTATVRAERSTIRSGDVNS